MRRSGGVSGAVSLVMIFCVLCLTVFAVLTLSTAVREQSFAALTAEHAAAYYEADRQAVKMVADLRAGREPEGEVTYTAIDEGTLASFSLPAGGELNLEVMVLLNGSRCEVLSWKAVYGGEWTTDESMNVWDGTF